MSVLLLRNVLLVVIFVQLRAATPRRVTRFTHPSQPFLEQREPLREDVFWSASREITVE